MTSLYSELKRRNVVRVGLAYAVVSWLLIQLAGALEPALLLPDWVDRVVTVFLLIGFPIVLIFAWAFELTPEGIKKTRDVDPDASITRHTGKKLEYTTIALLGVVVIFFLVKEFALQPDASDEIVATEAAPASIAVMPFDDYSPNKDQDYFSKGIAEEILNLLAKTGSLRVAARTSAFALAGNDLSIPEIGEKLDVSTVLEGSIRTSGDKIRVTAQLIKVSDGYHIWSHTYDADSSDIFAIQDEIAGKILEELRVHLLPEEAQAIAVAADREIDLDAYNAFLIGRERLALRTRDDILAAREQFRQTLAIEPDYAPAHVGIAHAGILLEEFTYGGDNEFADADKAEIENHLGSALSIAPDLPEAVGVQGYFNLQMHEYQKAEENLNRAIELSPSYAQAYSWRAETAYEQERYFDMLADREKAYALDPMSLQISKDLARDYTSFWRPADAQRVIDRMFALHPEHPLAFDAAIQNLSSHGRNGEALIMVDEALEAHPEDSNLLEWQAWLLLVVGLVEDAEETNVPEVQFYAKLIGGDAAGAKQLVDEHLSGEDPSQWYGHARDYLRIADEGPANPLFADYLQASLASFQQRNVKWNERCMLFLVKDLRDAGRAEETESMMQECHKEIEERLKAKFLCPCTFYAVVMYTVLDGRPQEAIERADQWLDHGDASAFLPYESIFAELKDNPAYPEILARNAAQLERQREIYFAGRSTAAATEQ